MNILTIFAGIPRSMNTKDVCINKLPERGSWLKFLIVDYFNLSTLTNSKKAIAQVGSPKGLIIRSESIPVSGSFGKLRLSSHSSILPCLQGKVHRLEKTERAL